MTVKGYMLIGIPASGKSSHAKPLSKMIYSKIISTDLIRKELYGSEEIQGNWKEIEATLHKKIFDCIEQNQDFIIDGTHTVREHRKVLLNLDSRIEWTGIVYNIDKETAKDRNSKRTRKVPDTIINRMFANLTKNPPEKKEGFHKIICYDM
tara:strand:+ start:604 stop:1056 length:453 start_codon:yes stop_codon:yes gene_type:complete